MKHPKVAIVVAKCSHYQRAFGIRFEQKTPNHWTGDWAFAIKEASAKREGYDNNNISGSFTFDNAYPGCPHCKSQSLFLCSCGKVTCWDGQSHCVDCPHCGSKGEIGGEVDSLNAGQDR